MDSNEDKPTESPAQGPVSAEATMRRYAYHAGLMPPHEDAVLVSVAIGIAEAHARAAVEAEREFLMTRDTYGCGHARQSDHDPLRCATCTMQAAERRAEKAERERDEYRWQVEAKQDAMECWRSCAEMAQRELAEARKLLLEVETGRLIYGSAGPRRKATVHPRWTAERAALFSEPGEAADAE